MLYRILKLSIYDIIWFVPYLKELYCFLYLMVSHVIPISWALVRCHYFLLFEILSIKQLFIMVHFLSDTIWYIACFWVQRSLEYHGRIFSSWILNIYFSNFLAFNLSMISSVIVVFCLLGLHAAYMYDPPLRLTCSSCKKGLLVIQSSYN